MLSNNYSEMVTAVQAKLYVYFHQKREKTLDCYVLVERLLCLRGLCCGVVLVVCSVSL